MISDFDKKIFDLFCFATRIHVAQTLNFCMNQLRYINLLEKSLNSFGIIQDFQGRDVIVFNLDSELVLASCINITSIRIVKENFGCFSQIPVIAKAGNLSFDGFLFDQGIVSNFILRAPCESRLVTRVSEGLSLVYNKGITQIVRSTRERLWFSLIDQSRVNINFDHNREVVLELSNDNQGSVLDYSDRDFFIPSLTSLQNSSLPNVERFISYVAGIKWNPFSWDFFKNLFEIIKIIGWILLGSFICILAIILLYYFVRIVRFGQEKYRMARVAKPIILYQGDSADIELGSLPCGSKLSVPLETSVYRSPVRRRSSAEFNALVSGFELLQKKAIFNSQKFKHSILENT